MNRSKNRREAWEWQRRWGHDMGWLRTPCGGDGEWRRGNPRVQAAALAVVSEGIVTTVARASRRAACPLPWKHWWPCCLRPPHLWLVQLTWDTWGHMYPPPSAVTHVLYMDLTEFAVSVTID
jgi:hypothetical protein